MGLSNLTMYQVCLVHSRAERMLKALVSKRLEEVEITRMEWLLLASLTEPAKNKEGHTMGEIANTLDIRLSQLTSLVASMNRKELLSQVVSQRDRRTKYLIITPKGVKFLNDIEKGMKKAMDEWKAKIPGTRLASYMKTVEELGRDNPLR